MIELILEEELQQPQQNNFGAVIRVIGVGGAGGNAVNSMVSSPDLKVVNFVVANTDAQALSASPAPVKIQLGSKITKGLGAGANPEIGRKAAEEGIEDILQYLMDVDILFLTAGLGGGTGSGAIPVIAKAAKDLGILTVAVVTKPFAFEGKRRAKHALEAIEALRGVVDTLIVVPNQKLLEIVDSKISMLGAFALSNDILKQAIKGISDIIAKPGLINVDFADIKTIMKDMGMAVMGTGSATGVDRAREAAIKAINSPLLENTSIAGARGVLINVAGNKDLQLQEISDAATMIYEMVSEDANIILGSVIDESLCDEIIVTVIATGCIAEKSLSISSAQKSSMPVEIKPEAGISIPSLALEPSDKKEMVLDIELSNTQSAAKSMIEMIDAVTQDNAAQLAAEESVHTELVSDSGNAEVVDSIKLRNYSDENSVSRENFTASVSGEDLNLNQDDLDTPTFMRKKQGTGRKEA